MIVFLVKCCVAFTIVALGLSTFLGILIFMDYRVARNKYRQERE